MGVQMVGSAGQHGTLFINGFRGEKKLLDSG
jgi:hypothetical protein